MASASRQAKRVRQSDIVFVSQFCLQCDIGASTIVTAIAKGGWQNVSRTKSQPGRGLPVLGKDERAERVDTQRRSRPNIEPSRHREGFCSAGASLRRANAGLVKLIAPVLLRSAPKVVRLARRGVLH
jgi:hypothetical protein